MNQKVDETLARFERITTQLDQRDGAVRDAARRERQRLNAGLFGTVKRIGIAIGLISLATIAIGLIVPIGMFGFLAAIGLAIGVSALLAVGGGSRIVEAPNVAPDLPNGQMVQRFDSYIYRSRKALPAPAQAEVDALSAMLPPLRQTLERVPDLDPEAQDARRLLSKHLPGLIDRYLHVPPAYRGETDGEGKSVDDRLVEALAAGRQALGEIGERLARNDVNAFDTQGRFITTRYKDETLI